MVNKGLVFLILAITALAGCATLQPKPEIESYNSWGPWNKYPSAELKKDIRISEINKMNKIEEN